MDTTGPVLTRRQLQLVDAISHPAGSGSMKVEAHRLGMAYATAKRHMEEARMRLEVSSCAQVVRIAVERGWLDG